MPPEDLPVVREMIERAAREGTDLDFDHRLTMPDGHVKYVHVVAHAVRDAAGNCEFVGVVSDVTATKQAEERHEGDQRQIRRIIDALPQHIVVLEPEGETLYTNQVVLDYTGLTLEESQGEAFRVRVFHPDDVASVRDERRQALARGAPFAMEQRARWHDGQYRWFLIRYNSLRDEQGRILRWYATGTDIDDHKHAEERMRTENLALREDIDRTSMFEEIVGSSEALRTVLRHVA